MKFGQFLFLLFSFILLTSAPLSAQTSTESKADSTQPRKLTKREKEWLAERAYWKLVDEIKEKSREEKNTMAKCPLHGKKDMPLSDNYRPNASDFTTCDEYPFAYQLNYRRYCKICTKIMADEAGEKVPVIKGITFERCSAHNIQLKGNPDYTGLRQEDNPNNDTPYARQYNYRTYCRVCTKIEKSREKVSAAEEKEAEKKK